MTMNTEDQKRFNSPSWWREAINNPQMLESFISGVDKFGVQGVRRIMAEYGHEFTPGEVESQYKLYKETLKRLNS